MNTTTTASHIRWMVRRDLAEVLQIEVNSQFAWNEEDFLKALRQSNCIGMVTELEDRVVGFMIYELHKKKIHIINLGIDPQFYRHGIGTQMIDKLLNKLCKFSRIAITAHIRESNLNAQLFFAAQGFRAIEVLRRYYGDEDTYKFKIKLNLL